MLFYFLLSRKSINFEEIFKINDMDKTYLNNVGQKQRKHVVRWANGMEGFIIDLKKNGVLRFVESCTDIDSNECDKKDMDINYPYVASGIVAWWFKYHKSQKEFELFEKYYRQRLSQYRKKREKEPNSFNYDIESEFLKTDCLQMEKEESGKCQIYNYVSESDGYTIRTMIYNYNRYVEIKKFIYHLPSHMPPKKRLDLEYKILYFLYEHGEKIDTSIKDSPQIYNFKDFRLYSEVEITEASLYLKQKRWIWCFNEHDEYGVLPSYWHELLDDGKIALREYLEAKGETSNSGNTHKKNQSAKKVMMFRDIVQGKNEKDKNDIIKRLHGRIDNKGGKLVALYLLKAMDLELISKRPTEKEYETEFTTCGKWHSISTYLNPNKRKKIEGDLSSIKI